MPSLDADEPLAVAATRAIHEGDVDALRALLGEHAELATARIRDAQGCGRTLLHVVTDWPGHFPNGPATVAALVEAGADLDAPFEGGFHTETALHWAASSDDVAVLDALLDAGADIEAPGSVIPQGTPIADAVAFGQWQAARRLVERGARTTLWQAAALGLLDRVDAGLAEPGVTAEDVTNAFWQACHGGQRETAEVLLRRGAAMNWVGWDDRTPLDIAAAQDATELVEWLRSQGGKPAAELG
jgi:ankyrin repeat protein